MNKLVGPMGCACRGRHLRRWHRFLRPPRGERSFLRLRGRAYPREVYRCELCGHYVSSLHGMPSRFYAGEYREATYGTEGLREAFETITALPVRRSDNAGRVRAILDHDRRRGGAKRPRNDRPRVLDVGSGLCVFLHRMKAAGWRGTAVDPDPAAVRHAREQVGVRAILGDFLRLKAPGRHDLVTFNKVLEHVSDPVRMLAASVRALWPGGWVYAELPDGEAAAREGPEREEFFVEHLHVFSPVSAGLLASRAGLEVERIERLREPSGKFTLRAFLSPCPGSLRSSPEGAGAP